MDGGFREWLGGLSGRELVLLGVLGAAALGGAGLWYVRSLPQPVAIHAEPVAAPSVSSTPAPLLVHVVGSVRRPGVYELPEGSRVVDALNAAGGPKRHAELSALNLAAPLTDGQQIVVPRTADVGAPVASAPGGASAAAPALVNINTASAEELDALPGIGEVLAAAIIQYREEHGPFTSVEQLVDVSGIGEVTLEELRDLVTI